MKFRRKEKSEDSLTLLKYYNVVLSILENVSSFSEIKKRKEDPTVFTSKSKNVVSVGCTDTRHRVRSSDTFLPSFIPFIPSIYISFYPCNSAVRVGPSTSYLSLLLLSSFLFLSIHIPMYSNIRLSPRRKTVPSNISSLQVHPFSIFSFEDYVPPLRSLFFLSPMHSS